MKWIWHKSESWVKMITYTNAFIYVLELSIRLNSFLQNQFVQDKDPLLLINTYSDILAINVRFLNISPYAQYYCTQKIRNQNFD
jgi:hypothetical protein